MVIENLRNSTKIDIKNIVKQEASGLIALHSKYISVIILVSITLNMRSNISLNMAWIKFLILPSAYAINFQYICTLGMQKQLIFTWYSFYFGISDSIPQNPQLKFRVCLSSHPHKTRWYSVTILFRAY